jgi:nitroreductase
VRYRLDAWDSPNDAVESAYRRLRSRHARFVNPQRSGVRAEVIILRDLLDIMWQRHTSRAAFDPTMQIRERDLQRILDAARWAPTAHNMQNFEIIVVDEQQRLSAISAIQLAPMETFIRETHHQLSLSEAELLRRKTGLLASMFPESWHEAEAVPIDSAAAHHTFVGRTIQKCPVLLVVLYDGRLGDLGSEEAVLSLMSLGCVMQNIWLMSESLGISMQVLSGLGASAVESQAQSILDIPQHLKIAFAARLGYPMTDAESYMRVRRRIQDFTHRNRYGLLPITEPPYTV